MVSLSASDTKSAPLIPNWRHRRQISVSDEKFSVSDIKFGVIDVKWRRLIPNDAKWCQMTLKLGIWRRSSSSSDAWFGVLIKKNFHYVQWDTQKTAQKYKLLKRRLFQNPCHMKINEEVLRKYTNGIKYFNTSNWPFACNLEENLVSELARIWTQGQLGYAVSMITNRAWVLLDKERI